MFVHHAFVLAKSRELKYRRELCIGYNEHIKTPVEMEIMRGPGSFGCRGLFVVFLFFVRKEVITEDETGNNNTQRKKSAVYKEHNAHTDTDPE